MTEIAMSKALAAINIKWDKFYLLIHEIRKLIEPLNMLLINVCYTSA